MATINLGSIKFNWKGAFNNSTAYAVDDVVSSGGNSYVCIQASQGNAVGNATAYWNIMSAAGAAGAEGGTSTLTTRGDLLTRGASAVARLAKGTAGQVLGQGANDPAWVNGSSSTLTTQGDILYRDGSGLQRLAKGTANKVLAMNSAANAPEWQTVAAGGKILQIVSTSDATTYTGTPGQSFIEPLTSLRAAITPSATNSKIFIILTLPQAGGDNGNVASGQLSFDTAGGSSNVIVPPNSSQAVDSEYAHFPLALTPNSYTAASTSYSVLHSPSTTSALTYKFRAKTENNSGSLTINRTVRNSALYDPTSVATITAMEIGA